MVKSNVQKRRVRKRPLATTSKTMRQKRKPIRLLKKTKRASRRIKLIDATSRSKSKKVEGGTSVIFLANDSPPRKSGNSLRTLLKSPVIISPMKIARLGSRFINHSKAREGVDFFCNLGQRVLQSKPVDRQKRLLRDGGEGGSTNGIVRGGRPTAGGLEASRLEAGRLEAGRLAAGGLGAAVEKMVNGGPKVGAKRGIDLAEVPRGTEVQRSLGLGTLCPGPVLKSSAKDVVVPLANRLPIIDFISTNEFNKMNETQKSSRRQHNR